MAVSRAETDTSEPIGFVERNIAALLERRKADEEHLRWPDRVAEHISGFAGSMTFIWLHVIGFGTWIAINLGGIPFLPRFDASFLYLGTAASVEAIFLSTFVLIAQNRMQVQADQRADLNLQVSLLSEHEVTRLIKIVTEIGERLNVPAARHPELAELKQDVRPEEVLETLERRQENARGE